jgi:hypothetical protein
MYQIFATDGKQYGPVNADQVRQWIREQRVTPQTPVWVTGSPAWVAASTLPEFAGAFPRSAPPRIGPPGPNVLILPAASPSHSMAKTGMVCGILSITIGCCCGGLPFNILGLVFSVIALVQISENPQRYGGRDLAIIGLILSSLGLIVLLLSCVGRL